MSLPQVRTRTRPTASKPSSDTYEVGYGKPPKSGQFKTGHSGNPDGRPKGSTSLMSEFRKIANENVTATLGGRQVTMTMREAGLRRLFEQGLKGHLASMALILKLEAAFQQTEAASEATVEKVSLSAADKQQLKEHLDYVKSLRGGG